MSEEANRDGVDSQSLALVGMFAAIVAVVIIIGVQVLFYRMEKADIARKYVEPGVSEVTVVMGEQRAKLAEYKWTGVDKEFALVPIERAMEVTVRQLQGKKP